MYLSSLILLLPSLVLAVDVHRDGYHYPPDIPTFDPVEYFKDKQLDRPTITAYRACPPRQSTFNFNHSFPETCKSTWLSVSALPVSKFSIENGYYDMYDYMYEKLTWKGTNTAYPILIGLDVAGLPTKHNRMEAGAFPSFCFWRVMANVML